MTALQVCTAPQGSSAWFEERRNGVGASDVAGILGISPWKTPLDVWLSKQPDHVAAPETEAMRWGHTLEPVVRDRYRSDQPVGVFVDVVDGVLAHPKRRWMRASLDGLVHARDGDWVLEVKTSRKGFDEVPQHYVAQALWQMSVTSLDRVDFACLFGGSVYRTFTVESDQASMREIADYVAWWWDEHVVSGRMPDPDPVRDAPKLGGLWKPVAGESVDVGEMGVQLRVAREALDAAQETFDRVVGQVKVALGEATVATTDGVPVASWTATSPRRSVDVAALKIAGLYDEFTRVGEPGRMFRVK